MVIDDEGMDEEREAGGISCFVGSTALYRMIMIITLETREVKEDTFLEGRRGS